MKIKDQTSIGVRFLRFVLRARNARGVQNEEHAAQRVKKNREQEHEVCIGWRGCDPWCNHRVQKGHVMEGIHGAGGR